MKTLRILLTAAALLCAAALRAQETPGQLGVTKADAAELVRFLQQEIDPTIFFVADTTDKKSYTVRGSRADFPEKAFAALRENGWSVTRYDDRWFVLRGKPLSLELPDGYFRAVAVKDTTSVSGLLEGETTTMTFQNKV